MEELVGYPLLLSKRKRWRFVRFERNRVDARGCGKARGPEALKKKDRKCPLVPSTGAAYTRCFQRQERSRWLEGWRRNDSPSIVTNSSNPLTKRVHYVMQSHFFSYSTMKDLGSIIHVWHAGLFLNTLSCKTVLSVFIEICSTLCIRLGNAEVQKIYAILFCHGTFLAMHE